MAAIERQFCPAVNGRSERSNRSEVQSTVKEEMGVRVCVHVCVFFVLFLLSDAFLTLVGQVDEGLHLLRRREL